MQTQSRIWQSIQKAAQTGNHSWIKTWIKAGLLSVLFSALMLLGGIWQQPAWAEVGQVLLRGTTRATSDLAGIVNLQDSSDGLKIEANLRDVPTGRHGFHIHEFGSCANLANAAGGHYNPDKVKHGELLKDGFAKAHAGDLGNIEASRGAAAVYRATLPGLSLSGGKYAVAGRAFVVHEKPDDFGQPTGNAGGRIGCGIITIVAPPAAT